MVHYVEFDYGNAPLSALPFHMRIRTYSSRWVLHSVLTLHLRFLDDDYTSYNIWSLKVR